MFGSLTRTTSRQIFITFLIFSNVANFLRPTMTIKKYPNDGKYKTRSATTNPTLKNIFDAGENNIKMEVIPSIKDLKKIDFSFRHVQVNNDNFSSLPLSSSIAFVSSVNQSE